MAQTQAYPVYVVPGFRVPGLTSVIVVTLRLLLVFVIISAPVLEDIIMNDFFFLCKSTFQGPAIPEV